MSIKKIIVVVLLMMFIIPLFNIDQFRDPENAWDDILIFHSSLLLLTPAQIPTAKIT